MNFDRVIQDFYRFNSLVFTLFTMKIENYFSHYSTLYDIEMVVLSIYLCQIRKL